MKNRQIFLLFALSFWACHKEAPEKKEDADVEVTFHIGEQYEVINQNFSGMSNALFSGGQFFTVTATEARPNFPGYPDANAKFYTLSLDGDLSAARALYLPSAAADAHHVSLAKKADGNLAVAFQKPTGILYGFDLEYKEFTTAGILVKSERIFSNANWGSWPRLAYTSNGNAHLISFAQDNYCLKYFRKKANGSQWEIFNATSNGKYRSDLEIATNGNDCLVSFREHQGNDEILKLLTISGDQFAEMQIDQHLAHNCDLLTGVSGNTWLLYTVANQLKLTNKNTWQYETVGFDENIENRAKVAVDSYGRLTVVYQTPAKVVVMQKQNQQWVKIWQKDFDYPLDTERLGQGATLVQGADGLYVIYPTVSNISKHKL